MTEEVQPAGASNTEPGKQQPQNVIPYERFKEVNDQRKALEARLTELEKTQREAQDALLAEQNQWKALYEKTKTELDQLRPIKLQVDEIKAALAETVLAEIGTLPEDMRALVPEFDDPRKTLAWLTANKAKLLRPPAPATDAGQHGDTSRQVQLTPGQQTAARAAGMTDEQYIAALLKIQGRRSQE